MRKEVSGVRTVVESVYNPANGVQIIAHLDTGYSMLDSTSI